MTRQPPTPEEERMIREAAAHEWERDRYVMGKADYIEWMLKQARGEIKFRRSPT